MEVAQPIAGPSRLPQVAQKPRSARAGRPAHLDNRTKFPPPPPPSRASSHPATRANGQLPTLPIKVLQGQSTKRTDAIKPGYSRDMVFVTRKTSLGSLMSRCRSLLVDEGYTQVTLYAMGAAIPHALLLLHALIDILPYPKGPKGMWYEMRTGTTECTDEVQLEAQGLEADEFAGIGSMEAEAPTRKTRLNSTIRIDLHITPKAPPRPPRPKKETKRDAEGKSTNRPSKRKRRSLLLARQAEKQADSGDRIVKDVDEEEMMSMGQMGRRSGMDLEEEEAVEEVEVR